MMHSFSLDPDCIVFRVRYHFVSITGRFGNVVMIRITRGSDCTWNEITLATNEKAQAFRIGAVIA